MSTTAQLCKCLVIGASLKALSGSGLAYNESGHLESVRLLLRQEGPLQNLNAAEKSVVAACAQLPDLSRELDAIVTYRNALVDSPSSWPSWAWWNTPSKCADSMAMPCLKGSAQKVALPLRICPNWPTN